MSSTPWQPDADADRGDADPRVRGALASAYDGGDAYARAVAALCTARLILPTVPAPADAEPGASERRDRHEERPAGPGPEMAVVQLRAASGDKAVAVFTGTDALQAWRPDARPVRCTLDDVAATVLETGSVAILVDVAGPHSLVIEAPLVAELAQGRRLVELPDGGFGWLWLAEGRASDS
jgi:hypothetical protein